MQIAGCDVDRMLESLDLVRLPAHCDAEALVRFIAEAKVDTKPVASSLADAIGYDRARRVLEVRFTGGRVSRYLGVPEHVHRQIVRGPSVGRALHQLVFHRFTCVRVAEQTTVRQAA